ncbi:MAG TPA: ATP-binding protein [Acidimicrobiales bacterium]|nr:ATP-binding protein [Acidimicrobiales bacterium]
MAQSVREARRFLEAALPSIDADTLYTAQLLTSELVTNAVLHAGTGIDVRAWEANGRVHVRVTDEMATRLPVPHEQAPDAGTGRGLHMVEHLSAACGVEVSPAGKTVWFELWPNPSDLKPGATWSTPRPAKGQGVRVSLIDMPVGLSRAAQRHRAALLREARLILISGGSIAGIDADDIRDVAGLNDLLDNALSEAVSRDPKAASLSLDVDIPSECRAVALRLSEVLDILNTGARAGALLTRPSLPEVRRVRIWLLTEVASQLDGGPVTPWAGRHELQGRASREELLEFDPTDVHARSLPAVAADDDNTILAVNDGAASLLGWDPEQLVGERITALIPPDWRERHVAGFTNFLLTGESTIMGRPTLVPALRHDGVTVEVYLTIEVEQSRHGRTVFVAELEPADSVSGPQSEVPPRGQEGAS